MKMQAFFDGVWAKAVAEFPDGTKSAESKRLFHSIIACLHNGESDLGYVRNALGYDTDLPSTERDGAEYISRRLLFQKIFSRALNEVRLRVANSTAGKIWGVNFMGNKAAALIMAYCNSVERDASTVKFIPPKVLKARLKTAGYAEQKNGFFVLPIADYTRLVLSQVIPPHPSTKKCEAELAELNALAQPTEEQTARMEELAEMIPALRNPAVEMHSAFSEDYRERLAQYTDLRSERMTAEFADIADDFGAEW